MKKEYQEPSTRVHKPVCAPCKAYPWPESQMPATGGYAYPQVKAEPPLTENEEEWGNLW